MSSTMKRILLETMSKEEMAAELEEIFFDTKGSTVIGKTKKMKQAMDYFWDYRVCSSSHVCVTPLSYSRVVTGV